MALNHSLECFPFDVGPGKRPRVEQHFPNILGECIPVPDPKVVVLVPAKEEPFQVQCGEEMIDSGYPLGHAVVVRVFRFERELKEPAGHRAGWISWGSQAAVCPELTKSGASVRNQP